MENEIWVILLPIILLPVFFAMGWFAARIDMKTVLKQAKSVPTGFYKSLDALVDRNSGRAARELAEVIDQQPQSYDLNLTLGKLYRQRGENDKAINMHRFSGYGGRQTGAGIVRTGAELSERRPG